MKTDKENPARLRNLVRLAALQKGKLTLSVMLAFIGQACGIVPFLMIYYIVAEIGSKPLNEVDQHSIYILVFAGAVAVVIKHVCMGLSTTLSHISAYNILYDLRIKIAEKLGTLPLGYFNKNNTGRVKKVMVEDVENIETFLAHNVPDFLGALIYIIVATTVLFLLDYRLAIATIIIIPAGVIFQILAISREGDVLKKWFSEVENMNAVMLEYIQGMPIIKAFNHSVESFSKFTKTADNCLDFENKSCSRWYLPMSIFHVSITANMLILLPAGTIMYLADMVTLQMFVFFLLIGVGFGNPMQIMLQMGGQMEKNLEGMSRIDAILAAESLIDSGRSEVPGQGIIGEEIEFGYDRKTKVINGIDFIIPHRKFIAMVGPSGAGKTTLARLIPRFWDIDAGSISLGETDIRNVQTDDLMNQFALIFQNVYLFNDTVLANILLGRPGASEAEVIKAAKIARCHEFIMRLSMGYNTLIGEKGGRISGGEKQCLSIARALLKDAPIIILDEATAFIDPENEALIQDAINQLIRNKTLIVIAHRISTIISADEILVLDKGRVVARGKHDQLLSSSMLYKNMWEAHISTQGWELSEGGTAK